MGNAGYIRNIICPQNDVLKLRQTVVTFSLPLYARAIAFLCNFELVFAIFINLTFIRVGLLAGLQWPEAGNCQQTYLRQNGID